MKRRIFLLCLLAGTLISLGCQSAFIRRDAEDIRAALLKGKPVGSLMADVEAWAHKKCTNVRVFPKFGYSRSDMPGEGVVVGVKSIEGYLGEYYSSGGFLTMVTVHWGFNEKGELIDVWVWKVADGA